MNTTQWNSSGGMGGDRFSLSLSVLVGAVLISASILFLSSRIAGGPVKPSAGGAQDQQAAVGAAAGETATPTAIGDRDVILGDAKAPVTLIEYGDYQCPFCVKFFQDVEPLIRDQYVKTGKVRMVFRGFQFLGPESILAAEAAECAKDQGKFWTFHDSVYAMEDKDGQENNGNITRASLIGLATAGKLDVAAFTQCFDSKKYEAQVKSGTTAAQAIGVDSTPTVFVNDQKFKGALPFVQFQTAIDAALKSGS